MRRRGVGRLCASGSIRCRCSSTTAAGITAVSTTRDGVEPRERVLVVGARPRPAAARVSLDARPRRRRSRRATTVMLSSPPPAFAASTSALRGVVEVAAVLARAAARISSSSTIVVSPSEQSRKTSPGSRLDRERVDVDVGVGAERARDHRALRVRLGLLGRELARCGPARRRASGRRSAARARRRGRGTRASRRRGRSRPCRRPRRARPSSSCPCPTSLASSLERS